MIVNHHLVKHLLIAASLAFAPMVATTQASTWTGGSGNWSDTGSPGWDAVPNGVGAVASVSSGNFTIANDVNPTIGTIEVTGSSGGTVQIKNGSFTLNQDGAGPGTAIISNSATNTSSRLSFNSALTFILADDLLIRNTSTSTGSYAIGASSKFQGTGNLTIYNVSNSSAGPISLTGPNTFTGDILIQKGALAFTSTGLGNAANAITLGSAGNGSASLVSTGSSTNLHNNITVAAGTGGTLLLGSTEDSKTSSSTFSGTITPNDDLSITSAKPVGGTVAFTNVISGIGAVTKIGSGSVTFSAANTYAGDTIVNDGTLDLDSTSELRFNLLNADASNRVLGTATVNLDGLFRLDAAGLSDASSSWNLVDVASLTSVTFGPDFGLAFASGPTFTNNGGGIYTSGDWTFNTATGNLIRSVPEPASLAIVVFAGALMLPTRRRQC